MGTRPAGVVTNVAVCPIHRSTFLLDRRPPALGEVFVQQGGLRGRMTRVRPPRSQAAGGTGVSRSAPPDPLAGRLARLLADASVPATALSARQRERLGPLFAAGVLGKVRSGAGRRVEVLLDRHGARLEQEALLLGRRTQAVREG